MLIEVGTLERSHGRCGGEIEAQEVVGEEVSVPRGCEQEPTIQILRLALCDTVPKDD